MKVKCPKCFDEVSITELLWANLSVYRWLRDKLWDLEDEIRFWRNEFRRMPKWGKPFFVIEIPLIPIALLIENLRIKAERKASKKRSARK